MQSNSTVISKHFHAHVTFWSPSRALNEAGATFRMLRASRPRIRFGCCLLQSPLDGHQLLGSLTTIQSILLAQRWTLSLYTSALCSQNSLCGSPVRKTGENRNHKAVRLWANIEHPMSGSLDISPDFRLKARCTGDTRQNHCSAVHLNFPSRTGKHICL